MTNIFLLVGQSLMGETVLGLSGDSGTTMGWLLTVSASSRKPFDNPLAEMGDLSLGDLMYGSAKYLKQNYTINIKINYILFNSLYSIQ